MRYLPDRLNSLSNPLDPKAEEVMMTTAEMLEARGEATMLLKILARRFGPLSEAVQQKVRAAGTERLDVWADRVLTATSLDEVLVDRLASPVRSVRGGHRGYWREVCSS